MPASHDLHEFCKRDRLKATDVNAIIRAATHHPPCVHVPNDPPWYNDAAATCPAYGVAAVTGMHGDDGDPDDRMAKGAQPTDPAAKEYIVNIDDELVALDEGNHQNGEWVLALYDDAVDTPALDEVWGPEPDEWYLTKGAASSGWGIVVAGIVDSTNKILLGKIVGGNDALPWYNGSSSYECPAYGVAAVTGVHGTEPDKIVQGDRPLVTIPKEYIVNTGSALPKETHGLYQNGEWVFALYETGTPAVDEVWVPKADQWSLVKGAVGAQWGVWVAGIVDSTNKILLGKIVEGPSEFVFHNSGGAEAPAYGVMGVSGVDGTSPDVVPKTAKPSATYRRDYLVNSQVAIADDARGNYQNHPELLALYYTSGTPALNELWGPTEGQWYLSKGSTGNGDANTTKTRADWGVIVAGIKDSTNKILVGKQVPYGMAKRCKCQIDNGSGILATDATINVDTVTSIDMGWAPVSAAADHIEAHIQLNPSNTGGYVGVDNTVCYIQFHEDDGYWWIYDMPCTA